MLAIKNKATFTTATIWLLLSGSAVAGDVQVAAKELVAPDLLSGTEYTLAANATIISSRAVFTLNSQSGSSQVTGMVSLAERANEIRAVQTLEALKKSDVYTDALKKSAKAPVKFGKKMIDDPVSTVSDTARGFGGFLSDIGYSLVSDDPSQDNVAKTGLGFAAAKRNFAFQMSVNPYSTYQPLQDALGEVSWTAVGGGLTVSAAFRGVSNTAGAVLTTTKTANAARTMVRDLSPRKLQNQNFDTLQGMGVKEELADTLLNNFKYDPEAETRLVTALDSMHKVAGREDVVARVALASSRKAAEEMRDWVELLAAYHELVKPAKRAVVISSAPFLVDESNTVHGIFPTDYVASNDTFRDQVTTISTTIKSRGLKLGPIYTTGIMDPKAAQLLLDLGWSSTHDHAERILRTR